MLGLSYATKKSGFIWHIPVKQKVHKTYIREGTGVQFGLLSLQKHLSQGFFK